MTAADVLALLRRVIAGDVLLEGAGDRWDDVYAGSVFYRTGDLLMVFFNDCGELDYVDRVEQHGRTVYAFDGLDPAEPINQLTEDERSRLLAKLR